MEQARKQRGEPSRPYHHGDLRRVLTEAALEVIAESGPAAVSLRDLARRAGVSHAAPAHHFGDKTGLLTAIAAEGYRRLADALGEAYERTGNFLEVGVAYVRFAIEHRPFFEVMFRPELYSAEDPDVVAAKRAASDMLYGPAATMSGDDPRFDTLRAGVAAWSLVHGFATLWLDRNLPTELGDDPERVARAVAAYLFRFPAEAPSKPRRRTKADS
jgi:AcrR family transcriptional regulator